MQILITGGSGFLGKKIAKALYSKGHEIRILSRSKREHPEYQYFTWNIKKGEIEKGALDGVEAVIHLAGAGIVEEAWTPQRKEELVFSRVEPIHLLAKKFQEIGQAPTVLVSASGIGLYGVDQGERRLDENSPATEEFVPQIVVAWEKAVRQFSQALNCRECRIRVGIVLDKEEGALPKMAKPVQYFVGSPLASGRQWVSWIHVKDVVKLFCTAIEKPEMQGPYNAVAPNPVRNAELTKEIAKTLKRPLFLPNVPAFVLKLILGERAELVTGSLRVKNSTLSNEFFDFPSISHCLEDIYSG